MKEIAVIGAGISGLAAAYLLSRRHRVHLFEQERRLGGHTHTILIDAPGGPVPLDTGFLVHNDRTYPNLVRLFDELGVATRDSDMSFAVSCRRSGLEYSSRGANGFFAQRRNLVRPSHIALLREILRFNREAPALLDTADGGRETLGEFLESRRFSEAFTRRYLFPMASAIWSASLDAIRSFPALTLIRFFDNHGLLAVRAQPTWKVVAGGSHTYIPRLTASISGGIHQGAAIQAVRRSEQGVTIAFRDRPSMVFGDVVFACHGDEVLPLLGDPSERERDVLAAFTTTTNVAWLHTDASVLPVQPRARASWNYLLGAEAGAAPTVTYDLNRLQGLTTPEQYCVTLNPNGAVDERRVLRRLVYRHPLYTREAIRVQARWAEVSGVNRTHYCGAYWGYGFHEDGLTSAIRVARALGVDWGIDRGVRGDSSGD
jgi:predicted NAD/FAD-binding protein